MSDDPQRVFGGRERIDLEHEVEFEGPSKAKVEIPSARAWHCAIGGIGAESRENSS